MSYELRYKADGEVLRAFLRDTSSYAKGIMGPIGSGKSVACVIDCVSRMLAQEPDPGDGVRRTRGAVIRNTTPELKTTAIKTWLEWVPEAHFGPMIWSPPITHRIRIEAPGGRLMHEHEVIFLALDRDEDVKKLLSLELTWAWANEARELGRAIVTALVSRVNRYPSMRRGGGATRPGLVMDTNAPHPEHWWPIMAGYAPPPDWMPEQDRLSMIRPANWTFYRQPPAMLDRRDHKGDLVGYDRNPLAENGAFLPADYYSNVIHGQTRDWIKNMVQGQLGAIFAGRPVYGAFSAEAHVSKEGLDPIPALPVFVGVDFGLTPAAVFVQILRGRVLVQREIVATDMGAKRFAAEIKRLLALDYDGMQVVLTTDPAGDSRAQTDEDTPLRVMQANGFPQARPAWSNDPIIRQGAVDEALRRMVDGKPGFLVDGERCPWVRGGFEGGYSIPEGRTSPVKTNPYSHPHDALQYALLGAGEGQALVRGATPAVPTKARTDFSGFRRARSGRAGRRLRSL